MWNAKNQKVCLARDRMSRIAYLLPQASIALTHLTSFSPSKTFSNQSTRLCHSPPHSSEGVKGSAGPRCLGAQEEPCSAAFPPLSSAWGSLIRLGMSRMVGPASNCLDSQEQCQFCLGEHRLHFHVNHPAKHKNLRWVRRQELPGWS